jgi:1,2-phenylacetyl-CoA epoxidase catalytic subunit
MTANGNGGEVHDLDPGAFEREVHSFEFWFQAVEGYLTGTQFGHRPAMPDTSLEPRERDRLITVLCNYCVGETAALEGASGLIAIAPNRLTQVFLSTQVVDEGRHLEVLLHRLGELGVAQPDQEIERRASASILEFRRRLLALVGSKDWEAALFAQNVILEAMEFTVFQAHAATADPITAEVLQGIVKDERRHIGFGENELGRRLRESPHRRARIAEVKRDLDALVLETFAETLRDIGIPTDERPDLGRSYLAAVNRLGVGVAR